MNPVQADGRIQINIGDDYYAADSRALIFVFAGMVLTGAVCVFELDGSPLGVTTVTSATTVQTELHAADTAGIAPPGAHNWKLVATLPDGHIETLQAGQLLAH